jgi:multidrug efflux pump subunit AcrA (membrane-fusion protein)
MEAKNADLSALRIDRNAPPASPGGGGPRWLLIAAPVVLLVAVGVILAARGLGGAIAVKLTPAVLVSPSQANVLATASGYVVAQRKAAVASKATGRLVYLGVVEGDKVRKGQVLARVEDGDVRAQLAQAQANLALGNADLHDAQTAFERQKSLLATNLSTQEAYDAADARLRRVTATIAVAQAGVDAAQVALENTIIRSRTWRSRGSLRPCSPRPPMWARSCRRSPAARSQNPPSSRSPTWARSKSKWTSPSRVSSR